MDLEPLFLAIQKELEQVEEHIHKSLSSEVPIVRSIASYVVGNGGKRLRPALCLLSSKLSGYNGPKMIDCAAGIEFLHTATLIHDDVVDEATLRRGKPSTNAKWGNQMSVLIGDFFFCRSSEILISGTHDIEVLRIITDAMTQTTEGEILEITKSNMTDTSEEDYLKVIKYKTAILFSAACEVGGLLGKLSGDFKKALKDFGTNLGIAFQLADDALDYVSDESKFGKAKGTDLKEGKLTLPLIVAFRKGNEVEQQKIQEAIVSDKVTPSQFKDISGIISKYGGIDYTLDLARSYSARAVDNLKPFKASIEKEALISLANYTTERDQ